MDFMLSLMFTALIQAKYEGGMRKFEEEGGRFGIAPGTPPELLVYHPSLALEMKNLITQAFERGGLVVRHLTTLNFQGYEKESIKQLCEENAPKIFEEMGLSGADVQISELYAGFALDKNTTIQQAQELVDKVREVIPGLLRTYVVYGEGKVLRAEYPPEDAPKSKVELAPQEKPARRTAIGDDDILNLRIALETATSVEDLIRSL